MDKKSRNYILCCIAVSGVVFRAIQFFSARSLWQDEAWTAFKILHTPFLKLIQLNGSSFVDMHAYPAGFLLTEKLMVNVLGNHELTLRLFPFICGVVSIFLFFKLAKEFLETHWAFFALALFCFGDRLVYYSAELKPYSCDVMFSLGLSLLFLRSEKKPTLKIFLYLGTFGVFAIFFSFTSVFILLGLGIWLIFNFIQKKEFKKAGTLCLVFISWALSLLFYYISSLCYFLKDQHLTDWFEQQFMPFWDGPIAITKWLALSFADIFFYLLRFPTLLASICFIAGLTALLIKNKKYLFFLTLPIFFVIIASAFHCYPFGKRTVLFLLPFICIIIVKGLEALGQNRVLRFQKYFGIILAIWLIYNPLMASFQDFIDPERNNAMKPAVHFLQERQQEGDALCMNLSSQYAYSYYLEYFGFNKSIDPVYKTSDKIYPDEKGEKYFLSNLFYGEFDGGHFSRVQQASPKDRVYITTKKPFGRNKRTWVLISEADTGLRNFMDQFVQKEGKVIDQFRFRHTRLYLIDFSG